jgi:hypothetical protein
MPAADGFSAETRRGVRGGVLPEVVRDLADVVA